jgi:biopolymer transport protein ExbB
MHGFDVNGVIANGWPVLSVLLLMSIFSVTVIVDRFRVIQRAQLNAARFIGIVTRMIREESLEAAYRYCRKRPEPVAIVAAAVIAQSGDRESRERVLQHTMQSQIRKLETYVPMLGTIASSAPFVGLLGTVIGIMRAFADIAGNAGGGPEVVAAGIAEALVTTAAGLLVAIPALVAYNFFVHRIQRLTEEIDLTVYDLIETLGEHSGETA